MNDIAEHLMYTKTFSEARVLSLNTVRCLTESVSQRCYLEVEVRLPSP